MRIMGINAGTSPRFAPLMQERLWIVMRNNHATDTATRGGAVCFDTGGTTYTDSGAVTRIFGYDFDKPLTANLKLCCGTADADIKAGEFGEVQVYGFDDDVAVNGTTGATVLDHAVPINDDFVRNVIAADSAIGDACVIVEATANLPANTVDGYAACLCNYMGSPISATS